MFFLLKQFRAVKYSSKLKESFLGVIAKGLHLLLYSITLRLLLLSPLNFSFITLHSGKELQH